ncbi:MAG: DUF2171 domain-containing protein [Tepidiformaceae bacterium]
MDHSLQVGQPITTSDGSDVGRVKEVQGGFFKVDAPMARDYWLSSACVRSVEGPMVRLNLRSDEVAAHELDGPWFEEQTDTTGDPVLADEYPLAENERRTQEIEEQTEHVRNP